MPGLAQNFGWNAARTEPFDFSLHYSYCAVCRYSVLSNETFIYTAGLLCVCNPRPLTLVDDSNVHLRYIDLARRARGIRFCSTFLHGSRDRKHKDMRESHAKHRKHTDMRE